MIDSELIGRRLRIHELGRFILKKLRNGCVVWCAALLVALPSTIAAAQSAQEKQSIQEKQTAQQKQQQTRQLLEWLGFAALLEQAPLALNLSIEAEAGFRKATPQQIDAWRRELEPRLKPRQLQQDLVDYVVERYRAETFVQTQRLLEQPLAKRVRYFDLAMAQPGVVKSLQDFRVQAQGEPHPGRRDLAQEIDAATSTSLLAAVLQTAVAERVRRAAGETASDEQAVAAQVAERQRYLAPLTVDYALYAYRYLRDDELSAYRDLLRDAQIQWLIDVGRQGLAAVLAGPVVPPDTVRQPDSRR